MSKQGKNTSYQEVVGLLPMAGRASRIAPLPCSKELLPVGFRSLDENSGMRPKVISHYMLEAMQSGGIKKIFIILRDGKWDIPSYYGNGKMLDMNIAYLMTDVSFGIPYTLDQAYPFVTNSIVALGFPDMVIEPKNAFSVLLSELEESGGDIVLGLFPAANPQKTDMVEFDAKGKVTSIQIKPDRTNLKFSWEIAVWTPNFTRFLHEYTLSGKDQYENNKNGSKPDKMDEMHVSEILQAAIQNKLKVDSVLFEDGSCLDIGTPEDLIKAVNNMGKLIQH